MPSDSFAFSFEEAVREFSLHLRASRAPKTVRFYKVQLGQLAQWADENEVSLTGFGKRHLDRYLGFRREQGKKPITVHHDAMCTKAFLKWCSRNDLVERNLLTDYEVRRAPRPPKHMPSDDEMRSLLSACHSFWDKDRNPDAKYQPPAKRAFHRDRNYAIILGLVDTACRIGEMLSLKVEDVRLKERQLIIRESKGREPRALPISPEWASALATWLKVRERVMREAEADEGWLFVSEFGGKLDEIRFLRAMKRVRDYAGLSEQITLHSLRRYSLNKLAKQSLLGAQAIAGHKNPQTTLIYTQLDPDYVREVHEGAGVARGVLGERRPKRKRLL
jgi:integrase/recombinase XerD